MDFIIEILKKDHNDFLECLVLKYGKIGQFTFDMKTFTHHDIGQGDESFFVFEGHGTVIPDCAKHGCGLTASIPFGLVEVSGKFAIKFIRLSGKEIHPLGKYSVHRKEHNKEKSDSYRD